MPVSFSHIWLKSSNTYFKQMDWQILMGKMLRRWLCKSCSHWKTEIKILWWLTWLHSSSICLVLHPLGRWWLYLSATGIQGGQLAGPWVQTKQTASSRMICGGLGGKCPFCHSDVTAWDILHTRCSIMCGEGCDYETPSARVSKFWFLKWGFSLISLFPQQGSYRRKIWQRAH